MFECDPLVALRVVRIAGWDTVEDIAFLRAVAAAKGVIDRTKDEEHLPKDRLTTLVADVVAEELAKKVEAADKRRQARKQGRAPADVEETDSHG